MKSLIVINGKTMGTTYSVKIVDNIKTEVIPSLIQSKIDSVMLSINQQMSTYIPNSEISIFNQSEIHRIYPSNEFIEVLKYSKKLSDISNGSFDITVGPLVQLWGFTRLNEDWFPPSGDKIAPLLKIIGNVNWSIESDELIKLNSKVQLDVNAVAKGFGVDAVSELISSLGYKNFMVEIGGEVYCAGWNENKEDWSIGIESPDFDSRSLIKIVSISDKAMATSGDYRNYFSHNGEIYSHTINPKNGIPIKHSLASATVISSTCMDADGIATTLLVMGTRKALAFTENISGVECFLIERTQDGEFRTFMSSGFDQYITD